MADKTLEPLTFGFDIGIASVGWCVLGENRIVDLGVRCFDKAETAKEGDPLNLARRTARLMRRRLRRRAWRLTKLARLLKREGLIADTKTPQTASPKSPWYLRVAGLDCKLDAEEWARVIYHLCKHRGFHWISKADKKKAEGDKKEGGRVTQGLSDTERYMTELGTRSVAKMVLTKFPDTQRNKQGNYDKALSRVLLADELALLFQRQRELGNPHADAYLEAKILGNGDRKSGLFWEQKPPLSGADLLKMLGRCTFERQGGPDGKGEYRAPKASFTAERHVWLTRLNNLRIVVDGVTRPLNEKEHREALPLPYGYANAKLDYKQLRTALIKKAGLDNFNFAGIAEDKEKDTLVKLPAWETLSKTLKAKGLETEWQSMAGAATGGDPTLLDEIARVLSVFKDGAEVEVELHKLNLPGGDKMIEALSEISFDKFHNLSLKALRKIVPHMEAGLRYDEACQAAGYHHSQLHEAGAGEHKYLPPFYARRDKDGRMVFAEDMDVPRNPVVLRALNQARKVLNALVRTYGSPASIHIEMARDLSRPLTGHWTDNGKYIEGRRDIEKLQEEYRKRNEDDKTVFSQEHGVARNSKGFGRDFEKFQIYREQNSQCPYCQNALDLNNVLSDTNYAQVDHALPYSRSYDDSKNNKVLVHTTCNQNKGNRTPYEYLSTQGGEDGERWIRYKVWVEATYPGKTKQAKRQRLLRKDFTGKTAEEFKERNLNDTRYICKFFKNYVERYLKLTPKAGASETVETTAKRCVVLNGQTTAFLRARWGLLKIRGESDRHHALDAAVVAACSHGMVKRLADYSRTKELAKARDGFPDPETGEILDPAAFQKLTAHFPDPWPHFRQELEARLGIGDLRELRARLEMFGTYPPEALAAARPLFVSRAPQRRGGGPIHEETIRSTKHVSANVSHVTVPLHKLKLSKLPDIIGATYSRNAPLIAVLRERLTAHNDDGKKAFAEPVFKPSKKGTKTPVKSVKLASTQNSGIHVRGGVAELGPMHHIEVFKVGPRYHLEPAYQARPDCRINPPNIPKDAEFLFSLSKNDFLQVTFGDQQYRGYFVMYESDGRLTLRAHDQPKPDKDYFRRGVTTATRVEKFHVDVLGNIYPAPPEVHRGLA